MPSLPVLKSLSPMLLGKRITISLSKIQFHYLLGYYLAVSREKERECDIGNSGQFLSEEVYIFLYIKATKN